MEIESVDELFATAALKAYPQSSPEAHHFLAHLLRQAREGHLCVVASPEVESLPLSLFETLLHREGDLIYLKRHWECERKLKKALQKMKAEQLEFPIPLEVIEGYLRETKLNGEQKEAVKKALTQPLTLICGGPGTGKTFTANTLLSLFVSSTKGKVAACAPTGKATANLRQGLKKAQVTFQTLHSLLKNDFLPFDLVLVDEGSMIDAELMAKLFSSRKEGSSLVLLGDPYQLPPVETGNFFADLSLIHKELSMTLTQSLRVELKEVLHLAEEVKEGKKVPSQPLPKERDLLQLLLKRQGLDEARSKEEIFSLFRRFRALSPLRKGPLGVETLNQKMVQLHRSYRHAPFLVPILIQQNEEELGLYNGDFALLDEEANRVFFEDGRSYPLQRIPRYSLSYVLSIHKSQGSEYEEVLILVPEGSESFGRELLYTGVTRAKRKVEIYGAEEIIAKVSAKKFKRLSGLSA